MKTYKIITCVFLFTSMFTQACQKDDETQGNPTPVPPEEEVPSSEFNYIYNQGTDGFELYRIPAIVKSKSNTLLAFAEARKARSNGDSGDIDLVVKRSSDNGKHGVNRLRYGMMDKTLVEIPCLLLTTEVEYICL